MKGHKLSPKLDAPIDPWSSNHSTSNINQVKIEWLWTCNLNTIELQKKQPYTNCTNSRPTLVLLRISPSFSSKFYSNPPESSSTSPFWCLAKKPSLVSVLEKMGSWQRIGKKISSLFIFHLHYWNPLHVHSLISV